MATNSELIAALACEDRDYIMGRATKALRESVTSILGDTVEGEERQALLNQTFAECRAYLKEHLGEEEDDGHDVHDDDGDDGDDGDDVAKAASGRATWPQARAARLRENGETDDDDCDANRKARRYYPRVQRYRGCPRSRWTD